MVVFMSFPPRFLDDIRSRMTLSDHIGQRVKLSRAGREFKGLCPFHKEKSPSFYVNDDKQFFHCFGCGAHGDVIGFTMRHDNLSFLDAVRDLAARAGLAMPEYSPEDAVRAEAQKTLHALMDRAAEYYQAQLNAPKYRDVMAYLTGRGLTSDTIANFRLGFAPGDDRDFLAHVRAGGFSDEQIILAGLSKKRDKDGTIYGFFRDRVMFPVMDRTGRVIAFGGRILPDHMRGPDRGDFKPPKYLNSPETPLFQKGRTVYAVSHARAAALEGQPIVVVEGYMDVIACHQAGVRGAVAPLGTALTEDQITLLWRMMPGPDHTIHLCFDGDEAGVRAAERAAMRMLPLLKPDHSARIAFLPTGEDPDTLIDKKGRAAFDGVMADGLPLAEYLWHLKSSVRRLDSPEDRAGLEADLDTLVGMIGDHKTKYHYQNFFRAKLRERFRAPGSGPAGSSHVTGRRGQQGGGPSYYGGRPVPSIKPAARPKLAGTRGVDVLLATLILYPSIFDQVDEKIGSLYIEDPARDALRQDLIGVLSDRDAYDPDAPDPFIKRIMNDMPQHADLVNYLVSEPVMVHAAFARAGADPDQILVGWDEVYDRVVGKSEYVPSLNKVQGDWNNDTI
jgi:DNA primase